MQGYNYCITKAKFPDINFEALENEFKSNELEYVYDKEYGLFFKSEQYQEAMAALNKIKGEP